VIDLPVPDASFHKFKDVYFITDLMETDLHKVIYSKQALSIDHVQYFLYQMLCALKYIHSTSVLHRDLKPSNVLLNSNCDLKICDFGLSRGMDEGRAASANDNNLTEYVVTRWYRAPEIMLSCQEYSKAIDVWSLGCIFGEMLLRKPLFPGSDYIHQLRLITSFVGTPKSAQDIWFVTNDKARKFMLGLPRQLPANLTKKFPSADENAIDLVRRMLILDPNERLTVDEALSHPFLESVRDPAFETVAKGEVEWHDIEEAELTKRNLQELIWRDVQVFHPNSSPTIEGDLPSEGNSASELKQTTAATAAAPPDNMAPVESAAPQNPVLAAATGTGNDAVMDKENNPALSSAKAV